MAPALQLFVYGTLKHGGRFHARLCRGALEVREASVLGQLFDTGRGYPALLLPASSVLAEGSGNPLADVAAQDRPVQPFTPAKGDWDTVYGELIRFGDPAGELPPIDRLEGFRPGQVSLYRRVLAAVEPAGGPPLAAWLYVVDRVEPGFRRLPGGRWPPAPSP